MSGLNTGLVRDAIQSHVAATGHYESVNGHEAGSPTGSGLRAAVFVASIGPAIRASGLSATSARIEFTVRTYSGMEQEPKDSIDPAVCDAVDAVMARLHAHYELGLSDVRHIDVLGSYGVPLSARSGYVRWEDGSEDRIMDITVPVIINDAWEQVA